MCWTVSLQIVRLKIQNKLKAVILQDFVFPVRGDLKYFFISQEIQMMGTKIVLL